ncbi:hypothetical protein Pst134EB_006358 [Puccinia striiformis f. sp. tritici]|nr:hypothetical protein Pst134EB_006358 [Puccinia striiformis f. sp. tritici]
MCIKSEKSDGRALRELGEGLLVLSTSDLSKPSLITTVEAYARLTHSVRLTFNGRVKAWDKSNSLNHRKKFEFIMKNQHNIITINLSAFNTIQLEEAERRAHEARNEFADVSKLIKAEFQRFDQEKVADFKASICNFVDGLTVRQRQIVKVWQEYYQLLQDLSRQNAHATSTTTNPQQQPPSNNRSNDNEAETEQSIPVHPTPSSSTPTFTSPIIATVTHESLPALRLVSTRSSHLNPSMTRLAKVMKKNKTTSTSSLHLIILSLSLSSTATTSGTSTLIVPDDSAVWATDDSPAPNPISALDLPSYE